MKKHINLKLLAATALVALAGFAGSAFAAQTININFASPADTLNGKTFIYNQYQQAPAPYTGTTWNDYVAADDGLGGGTPAARTVNNLLDSDGNATTVGWSTATVNATPLAGVGNWADHPDVKMLNSGFYRVFNSGSGNAMRCRIRVTGLDPLKLYHIYLACSAPLSLDNNWGIGGTNTAPATTKKILTTAARKTSQTWFPGDNWLVFYNNAPDQFGQIYIWGQNVNGTALYSGITIDGLQVVDATGWQNSDKSIYGFGLPILGSSAVVSENGTGTNITWTLPYSQNLTALAPTFTLADFATANPASGTTHDFSSPVDYTVTAQDGSTKIYRVTVTPAPPSTNTTMLTFTWGGYDGTIVGNNVTLLVPGGTDVSALNPTVTAWPFATISPASGSTHDFTSPVNYTVTAEDGVHTTTYSVTVLQTYFWTSAASGNWSTPANWNPGSPVSSSSAAAAFNTAGTYISSQDLGDGFQLNQLAFGGATVTIAGNSISLINNGSSLPQIVQNGTTAVTISNAVSLDANLSSVGTGSGQVEMNGLVSGTGALIKNGTGTLKMWGLFANNTYSGGTIINRGTLHWGTMTNGITPVVNAALGTGPVTLNAGATFEFDRGDNIVNDLILNGGTIWGQNGWGVTWNGNVTLNADTTLRIDYAVRFNQSAGSISGPGGFIKTGNSDANLYGVNTFTGGLTINAGKIAILGAGQLGSGSYASPISGSGTFTYNSSAAQTLAGPISGTVAVVQAGPGTLTLSGANTYGGTNTVSGGILEIANATSLGTNTLVVNAGGKVQIDIAAIRMIAGLTIEGSVLPNGLYGSSASGVISPDDTHFAGPGMVRVGPAPAAPVLTASEFSLAGGTTPTVVLPTTTAGVQYRLVYKDNLTDPFWTATGTGSWAAGGSAVTLIDPFAIGQQQRFYKIEVR